MSDPKTCLTTLKFDGVPNLTLWLCDQTQNADRVWLLAHALDGVIWGRFANGTLTTSHDADPTLPTLDTNTLLQCRMFGRKSEVMLWQNDDGWHTTTITDPANSNEYIDEDQLLWGDHGETLVNDFTRLSDGSQGLCHAVPFAYSSLVFDKASVHRPLRLRVRHILGFDAKTGGAFIRASRLVEVFAVEPTVEPTVEPKKEQDNEHVA